ncbi:hypothetical protein [Alphaproteobacteria bacterium endosymbiont of Tiliacea citrago]|uniref:hypothetical protein n=1 Tax=Alphaproteobacteria bacterium endosymbiont of Tiliacea citrago TaxID=3077944 RepID=UPI00313BC2E0
MNILVLAGGVGLEREVSLNSANNFLKNVFDLNFNFYLISVSLSGHFSYNGETGVFISSDDNLFFKTENKKIKVDYVFPIVHGKGAENGEFQAFFESLSFKKLIANSLFSSCVSFDKIISKKIAESLNIPVVNYIDFFFSPLTFEDCKKKLNSEILFLKPSDNGSSFGCSMVYNEKEFIDSLENLKTITKYPLVESYMEVIECSCSVLFHEVSDVIVINHGLNFFSYNDKYEKHVFKTELLQNCALINLIKDYSFSLFKAMRLDFLCRFDFFICKKSKKVYFNEVNSLPGFGVDSLFFHSFSNKYNQKDICKKIIMNYIEEI